MPAKDDPIISTSVKIPESLLTKLRYAKVKERRDQSEILADALRMYFAKRPSPRTK